VNFYPTTLYVPKFLTELDLYAIGCLPREIEKYFTRLGKMPRVEARGAMTEDDHGVSRFNVALGATNYGL
jgi:hypothetical protein